MIGVDAVGAGIRQHLHQRRAVVERDLGVNFLRAGLHGDLLLRRRYRSRMRGFGRSFVRRRRFGRVRAVQIGRGCRRRLRRFGARHLLGRGLRGRGGGDVGVFSRAVCIHSNDLRGVVGRQRGGSPTPE